MFKKFEQIVMPYMDQVQTMDLKAVFLKEAARESRYTVVAAGLTLNYAQQFVNENLLAAMIRFLERENFRDRIMAMFRGDKINCTENRAVLHTALRSRDTSPLIIDGINIRLEVAEQFAKMQTLVEQFFTGKIKGATAKIITDVVNIGIGGSDLGPRMVVRALRPDWQDKVRVHFVSNVDGTDLFETLQGLNPETTLFIVASKSFTTQETLMNAETAKAWLMQHLNTNEVAAHFIGITSKSEKAVAWGIAKERIFAMWDFVGGRYSLWSTIGLPIALAIGMDRFNLLLQGASELDEHFRTASWQENLPVLLALIAILNQNFLGAQSHAVLPYDQTLELLPAYLQQADMESNGKRVTRQNQAVDYQTGVTLWGGVGTNGQHAFHQLFHQGTLHIPVDFILPLQPRHPYLAHHQALIANCYGQKQALLEGRSTDQAYRDIPGNRSANLITFEQLNPKTLGALIALYEHKIFIQSLIWNINAFDQWGVELGKKLAEDALQKLKAQNG